MGKRGDRVNKAIELIYKLELKRSFRLDAKAAKARLERSEPLITLSKELLEKYGLPPTHYWEMGQYIQHGKIDVLRDKDQETLSIKYPDNHELSTGSEEAFKKLGQPYVGIYIHDASSKGDVAKIINRNWRDIQKSLRAQGGNTSRIKTTFNKEAGRRVSELLDYSVKDLRKKFGISSSQTYTKDGLVAQVMKQEGHLRFTPRMVKRIRETK